MPRSDVQSQLGSSGSKSSSHWACGCPGQLGSPRCAPGCHDGGRVGWRREARRGRRGAEAARRAAGWKACACTPPGLPEGRWRGSRCVGAAVRRGGLPLSQRAPHGRRQAKANRRGRTDGQVAHEPKLCTGKVSVGARTRPWSRRDSAACSAPSGATPPRRRAHVGHRGIELAAAGIVFVLRTDGAQPAAPPIPVWPPVPPAEGPAPPAPVPPDAAPSLPAPPSSDATRYWVQAATVKLSPRRGATRFANRRRSRRDESREKAIIFPSSARRRTSCLCTH